MVGAIFYIGDREVGKTALAIELANPKKSERVRSTMNYAQLSRDHWGPTTSVRDIELEIEVDFGDRLGWHSLRINSTDTPGEMWRDPVPPGYADKRKDVLKTARTSAGILVILPPYRELIQKVDNPEKLTAAELDKCITKKQWCDRFQRRAKFLREECLQARHIALCLNKADLFIPSDQLNRTAQILSKSKGHDQHLFALNNFFHLVSEQIAQINAQREGVVVRCFVTSIYNRTLLELPWIYLARYLSQD